MRQKQQPVKVAATGGGEANTPDVLAATGLLRDTSRPTTSDNILLKQIIIPSNDNITTGEIMSDNHQHRTTDSGLNPLIETSSYSDCDSANGDQQNEKIKQALAALYQRSADDATTNAIEQVMSFLENNNVQFPDVSDQTNQQHQQTNQDDELASMNDSAIYANTTSSATGGQGEHDPIVMMDDDVMPNMDIMGGGGTSELDEPPEYINPNETSSTLALAIATHNRTSQHSMLDRNNTTILDEQIAKRFNRVEHTFRDLKQRFNNQAPLGPMLSELLKQQQQIILSQRRLNNWHAKISSEMRKTSSVILDRIESQLSLLQQSVALSNNSNNKNANSNENTRNNPPRGQPRQNPAPMQKGTINANLALNGVTVINNRFLTSPSSASSYEATSDNSARRLQELIRQQQQKHLQIAESSQDSRMRAAASLAMMRNIPDFNRAPNELDLIESQHQQQDEDQDGETFYQDHDYQSHEYEAEQEDGESMSVTGSYSSFAETRLANKRNIPNNTDFNDNSPASRAKRARRMVSLLVDQHQKQQQQLEEEQQLDIVSKGSRGKSNFTFKEPSSTNSTLNTSHSSVDTLSMSTPTTSSTPRVNAKGNARKKATAKSIKRGGSISNTTTSQQPPTPQQIATIQRQIQQQQQQQQQQKRQQQQQQHQQQQQQHHHHQGRTSAQRTVASGKPVRNSSIVATMKMKNDEQLEQHESAGQESDDGGDHSEFICNEPDCGKTFPSLRKLRHHKVVHSDDYPFICEVDGCSKRFKRKFGIDLHSTTHFDLVPNMYTKTSNNSSLPFFGRRMQYSMCKPCGKKFKTVHEYQYHMMKHGEEPFKCPVKGCNQKFSIWKSFQKHRASHYFNYFCNMDGKCKHQTTNLQLLKLHIYCCHFRRKLPPNLPKAGTLSLKSDTMSGQGSGTVKGGRAIKTENDDHLEGDGDGDDEDYEESYDDPDYASAGANAEEENKLDTEPVDDTSYFNSSGNNSKVNETAASARNKSQRSVRFSVSLNESQDSQKSQQPPPTTRRDGRLRSNPPRSSNYASLDYATMNSGDYDIATSTHSSSKRTTRAASSSLVSGRSATTRRRSAASAQKSSFQTEVKSTMQNKTMDEEFENENDTDNKEDSLNNDYMLDNDYGMDEIGDDENIDDEDGSRGAPGTYSSGSCGGKKSRFKCHLCESRFNVKFQLTKHLSTHLELTTDMFQATAIEEVVQLSERKRRDYHCDHCDIRFEQVQEFDEHMHGHAQKPYICGFCQTGSSSFRLWKQYLSHLYEHRFTYKCTLGNCDFAINRKDALKLHIFRIHLNMQLPPHLEAT